MLFSAQDGLSDWGDGADFTFFISSAYMTESLLDECTVISQTKTSMEFIRKDRTFLIEILNPHWNNFSKSLTYKITSNGKSCTSNYKKFDITREACSWYYPEPVKFENSDGIIYAAEQTNEYEFRACFKKMFE